MSNKGDIRLVDEIASKAIANGGDRPTSSSILGPFWSPHAPFRNLGGSIIQDPDREGEVTFMHGTVTDLKTKKPIVNAVVDVWQAAANGEYDLQDGKQSEHNLRGKFRTNEKGGILSLLLPSNCLLNPYGWCGREAPRVSGSTYYAYSAHSRNGRRRGF